MEKCRVILIICDIIDFYQVVYSKLHYKKKLCHLFQINNNMKTFCLSLLGLSFSLVTYCQVLKSQRENGWYNITDGQQDSISQNPIVTTKDFTELSWVSDSFGKSLIAGKVNKLKMQKWADATEKGIGKRIGFIFNDTVITDPQVNARIESGSFQISNPYGYDLKRIYHQLLIESSTNTISISPFQPDSRLLWKEANHYRSSITDSTFLKTKGTMSDKAIDPLIPEGWNNDYAYNQVVYLKAMERVKRHLSVKENQFICSLKSGKEINISEDIYQYICRILENWNLLIAEGKCEITKDENGFYDIVPCVSSK